MDLMEKLTSLAKRRGFIFPSSEIYGGLNGCWDYGPLGAQLRLELGVLVLEPQEVVPLVLRRGAVEVGVGARVPPPGRPP